ncbi:MAG: plasmid stabilization protein [Alphaproteobacteria bacterium]|nr:MAG: plasmid stabilization protein [Alphaproteobacteria bacterium]
MANITIRSIPDHTKDILRVHAAQHGQSLESYIRRILQEAANTSVPDNIGLLDITQKWFGQEHGIDMEIPQRHTKRSIEIFE